MYQGFPRCLARQSLPIRKPDSTPISSRHWSSDNSFSDEEYEPNRRRMEMIKVKHVFDAIEEDDGVRIWIEPVGLTLDLCQWCQVHRLLPHLGPPMELWSWFEDHPSGYDTFRDGYHEHLSRFSAVQAV